MATGPRSVLEAVTQSARLSVRVVTASVRRKLTFRLSARRHASVPSKDIREPTRVLTHCYMTLTNSLTGLRHPNRAPTACRVALKMPLVGLQLRAHSVPPSRQPKSLSSCISGTSPGNHDESSGSRPVLSPALHGLLSFQLLGRCWMAKSQDTALWRRGGLYPTRHGMGPRARLSRRA